jgi:hypothetical protein
MSEVTRILNAIEHGDPHAASELLPLVYDELRKLAGQKLAWFTKPTSGSWTSTRRSTGTAGDTFLPQPPRPCAESLSRTPGENGGPNMVATGNGSSWTKRSS